MITVITPLHKQEFLDNTLSNFFRQSFKEKELLIICNGDMYETSFLFNHSPKYNYPNIHYINTNSCNIAEIRNVGLNWMKDNTKQVSCDREIFSFFDSDDYYATDYLEEAYNKLIEGYELVGKLNYTFKFNNDYYHVTGLKEDGQIHGPTITGYLTDRRFNLFNSQIGEDIEFVLQHTKQVSYNNIGYTSSNNWIYTVREDSIQRRSFNAFINLMKFGAINSNNKEFLILKNNEHYWRLGDYFNIEDLFK